jgi:hypothetical protein
MRRLLSTALLLVTIGAGLRPAASMPLYAARTGLDCRACHHDPAGGGPRNELGFLYARQRHDLTADPNPRWTQQPLTNRLGDAVFVGANARALYLFTTRQAADPTDVSTFMQMQGALHVTLRPHPNLGVVFSRDFGEFSGDRTRDLFGLIQDGTGRFYVKVGRVRRLFGLRHDDHTGGTRGGFLNSTSGGRAGLLPYDPRDSDSGIEGGIATGPYAIAASLTNGGPAFANRAQTGSAKLTASYPWSKLGLSAYDSYLTAAERRFTRWGGYALLKTPLRDVTVLAEAGFGTDDPGDGSRVNLAATFLEVDYRANRALVLRGRYDFADVNRAVEGNASERWLVEGDFTPVPFVDLKLSYRRVVPETSPDEHQWLTLWHFYY